MSILMYFQRWSRYSRGPKYRQFEKASESNFDLVLFSPQVSMLGPRKNHDQIDNMKDLHGLRQEERVQIEGSLEDLASCEFASKVNANIGFSNDNESD
ncbi:unnamed protein product, partial [Dovyalis caffra]